MPEHLDRIQPTDIDYLKDQEAKLVFLIGENAELRARVSSLLNRALTPEQLVNMVDSWNADHQTFSGHYVEKVFDAPKGMQLKVRMDTEGNIQLSSRLSNE